MPKPAASKFGVLFTLGLGTPPPPWYQGKRFTTAVERKRWYTNELTQALRSLRSTSPGVQVAVFTDEPTLPLPHGVRRLPLKTAGIRESGEIIFALRNSPFERSLIMDLDATVCSDIAHVSDFLTDFDAAFVIEPPDPKPLPLHAPGCNRRGPYRGCLTRVEANLGFFMLKRNARTEELLAVWQRQHARDGRSAQNALAKVRQGRSNLLLAAPCARATLTQQLIRNWPLAQVLAQKTRVRFLPLPAEYNARLNGAKVPLVVAGRVVVLHGRGARCEQVNGNASAAPRVLHRMPRGDGVGTLSVAQVSAAMLSRIKRKARRLNASEGR